MRSSKLVNPFLYVGLVIFLASCGSAANEKTTATDSTATADSAAKAKAASTILTTPQMMVVVTHKVADYAKWLSAYEADDPQRSAAGLHKYVIGRGLVDSNMILIAMKADDSAKALAFGDSPGLKEAMKKAGVIGAPTHYMTTAIWQDTSINKTALRSFTSLTVKDWNAFISTYEASRQERIDNGLMDRVIGHDIADNKKVILAMALTDTAKAFAYYKSDAIKKRREEGGVIGQPSRLLYWIVKRY
ncbi:hypothetical protein [Puia sp.]|jgi:hypothetical protein|uniref:hypothetical protein n=1 Tax=Puia sp. TaxID=2045100 RepID=UPI002F4293B1